VAKGVKRSRLDAELVRRGLARSREPATGVGADAPILVDTSETEDPGYASRGAHKLIGALEAFPGVQVKGRNTLDAGASTGGFTDVLLRNEAAHVIAVDVGYGQLVWSLQTDERVTVMDRTNVRTLTLDAIGAEPVDLVVSDLSFISLTLVLPALIGVVRPDGDLVLMVKPQFEVGKERLGKGGVVRDPELRADAVRGVARKAQELGWGIEGVAASPLPGPSGNVEYFLWIRRNAPALDETMLQTAIESGPQ
jgi:23S rRNA (cytidine1920-2'-O)/16S rRNA (cytidine1409-2'-O)-methyltransferase